MGVAEIAATEMRATGAYARADALAAPVAVRRADPARPRFDIVDAPSTRRPDGPTDRPAAPAVGDAGPGGGGAVTGFRRAREDSGFLTQAIAQAGDEGRPPASAYRAAATAYGRDGAVSGPQQHADLLSPFPRLASGRTLDLSV